MITLKLTDSIDIIEKRVNKALAELANDVVIKKQASILSKCKILARGWILSQPEIYSILSFSPDALAGVLGIPQGTASRIVYSIASSVENSISIKIVKFDDKLTRGGIEVEFQPSTFINLLNLPEGHVTYRGGDLHWLDWLLKRGLNVIVVNYQYNPQTGLGRSGLGVMVPGGSFRIPPEFAGTDNDNFVTRALIGSDQERQITKVFEEAFK